MSDGISDGHRYADAGRIPVGPVPSRVGPFGHGLEWMHGDFWALICTGEGAASVVASGANLVKHLHNFMCCCGKDLIECCDDGVLEILEEMRDPDKWCHDERQRLFQFSHEFEISQLTITRIDVLYGAGGTDL